MRVHVDAVSPYLVSIVVSGGGLDFTMATSARIVARRPSGVEVTWSCTLAAASASSVAVEHALVSGDVDALGSYLLVPWVTVAGSEYRCSAVELTVVGEWTL